MSEGLGLFKNRALLHPCLLVAELGPRSPPSPDPVSQLFHFSLLNVATSVSCLSLQPPFAKGFKRDILLFLVYPWDITGEIPKK